MSMALLVIVSCSSPSESTSTGVSAAEKAANSRYNALTAFTDAEVAEYSQVFGDTDGDWVLINTQGGASQPLFPLAEKSSSGVWTTLDNTLVNNEWLAKYKTYTVHQVQTKDYATNSIADVEAFTVDTSKTGTALQNRTTLLTSAEAEAIDLESVQWLARFIKHFDQKGKKIAVIGSSFGSFMVNELVAQYGTNYADLFISAVGRLNMDDDIVKAFSQGKGGGFSYPAYGSADKFVTYPQGTEIVKLSGEINPDNYATNFYSKNYAALTADEKVIIDKVVMGAKSMVALNAGLGQRRYTKVFADYDLSKMLVIWNYLDAATGIFTLDEVKFLKDKNVKSVSYFDNHNHPITVGRILDNIRAKSATTMDQYLEGVYKTEVGFTSDIDSSAGSKITFDQVYYNTNEAYDFAFNGTVKK